MNKNIANKKLTTKNGETKNHQAYAMEFSRLKNARKTCQESGNCFEFNNMGGQNRYTEVENLVKSERKKDELSKKAVDPTNPNNTYQKEKNPTEVSVPKVTKKSNHSGSMNKILSNSQALSEEILNIRYLIEYMNNNNKKI
jgi:hypothetical protein